ncbi:MAG TPA: alkaline phosphatase family protein [Vicinamibacterales bacterium]|nr:alkaline phosphatase family protein [Vicinamibacterales bacterium]
MKNAYARRLTLLGFATALAGSVAMPVSTRAMIEDRDDHNARTPIQHVVVIFQENVSFDHYFATYPNAANTDGSPFTAAAGTPLVNGLFPGGLLTANPNSTQPFRLSSAHAVTCDQDHGYKDEQLAFNAGGMNRFPETVGVGAGTCDDAGAGKGLVMGHYDGNTVTAIWNYAQHFAMSDASFGTTFGPSTPGALNLAAGQTHGATLTFGSASGNVTAVAADGVRTVIGDPRPALDDCTPSLAPTSARVTMTGRNVGDLLNERHVTWGWFQGGFRPTVPAVGSTPAVCGATHANVAGGSSADYIPHHQPFQYYAQTANPHHLPPSHPSKIGHADQANHQYDLEDFWTAAEAGQMPAVSFLKAAAFQDGHAGYSDPLDEQTFLVNTINRLMATPEWEHTAIVIAYDDSDGWYDHVMGPIVSQSNTPDDALFGAGNCGTAPAGTFEGRCGLGPRLPLLVISPWARQNYVDHSVTDQSSILRFIEDNWDLGLLGQQSTDANAGTLSGVFDFDRQHARAPQLLLNPTTGRP